MPAAKYQPAKDSTPSFSPPTPNAAKGKDRARLHAICAGDAAVRPQKPPAGDIGGFIFRHQFLSTYQRLMPVIDILYCKQAKISNHIRMLNQLSTILSYSGMTISNWHNNVILLFIFPSTAQVRCQASKNLPFCQPSFARQSILSASSKPKDTNIESICATPKIQQPGVQSFGNSDAILTAAAPGWVYQLWEIATLSSLPTDTGLGTNFWEQRRQQHCRSPWQPNTARL